MIIKKIREFFGLTQKANRNPNLFTQARDLRAPKKEVPYINIVKAIKSESAENYIVLRCMEFFAKSVSSIKFCIDIGSSELPQDILDQPNPYEDQISFIESIVYSMLRTGFAYVQIEFNDRPCLKCLDPGSVVPRFVREELVDFIVHGRIVNKNLIIYIKDTGQAAHWMRNGKSKYEVVKPVADLLDQILMHNQILIMNTPRVSGVVQLSKLRSDYYHSKLREHINDKFYDVGYVPIMPEGAEYEPIEKARELDYLEAYKVFEKQIPVAFGIPPHFVNQDSHVGYNTYYHARRHWFEDEVYPTARRIASAIESGLNNCWKSAEFEAGVKVSLDISKVPGLGEASKESIETLREANLLTTADKRRAYGAVN